MRSPTTAETFCAVVQSSGKTRENDSMALADTPRWPNSARAATMTLSGYRAIAGPLCRDGGFASSAGLSGRRSICFNHGPVAPSKEAPTLIRACRQGGEVDTGGAKGAHVLVRDADGEIAAPIWREIEIESAGALAHRPDRPFDELVGMDRPSCFTSSALSMR